MLKNLDVYIWGKKVGSLVAYKERYTEKACFYFDREFAMGNLDIAPVRASIRNENVQNGLPIYADDDKLFGGLPSLISDSLPDFWGNKVFDRWAKANHINLRDISALDRLAYIGRRGMGALEFLPPAAEDMETPFKVTIADLNAFAQQALVSASKFHAKLGTDIAIQSLFKVGTSAGGRRPKAIINVNLDTLDCYSGQVAAPSVDYKPMIIKFCEHSDMPTTRIEYSYYLMAKAAGLRMMPSTLVADGDAAHFLTERFDRKGSEKIHVQTLAAMMPLSSSYDDLFSVANRLRLPLIEKQQLYLLTVLNVLASNVDDHNKNFSFTMGKDGVWHVAPAYDFTYSVDTSAPWYMNTHCMTINGRNHDITRSDLLALAELVDIKKADAIIDNAIAVVKNYREYADLAGVDRAWQEKIAAEINRCCEAMQ